MNKTNSRKKQHATDLSLWRGASHLDKLPAFSFGSGASLQGVPNAAVPRAFDGSLSEFLQFRLYSLFGPGLLEKKMGRKTQARCIDVVWYTMENTTNVVRFQNFLQPRTRLCHQFFLVLAFHSFHISISRLHLV